MTLEEFCYDHPHTCYSCKQGKETTDNKISCIHLESGFKLLFDSKTSTEKDMEIEYRRALLVGGNCPHFEEKELLDIDLSKRTIGCVK